MDLCHDVQARMCVISNHKMKAFQFHNYCAQKMSFALWPGMSDNDIIGTNGLCFLTTGISSMKAATPFLHWIRGVTFDWLTKISQNLVPSSQDSSSCHHAGSKMI